MLYLHSRLALSLLLAVAASADRVWGQQPGNSPPPAVSTAPDFTREVRPLLAKYCFK